MKVVIDDCRLERMDAYTDPLNDKIKRQAAEITRLLADNAELKGLNSTICDVCKNDEFLKETAEQARAKGQQEAWELAKKIISDDGYSGSELKEIFGNQGISWCISSNTYAEAAAKVAEWERQKEEICVGDVVRFKENHRVEFCVTDIYDDRFLYGINAEGEVYADRDIELFEKTGRHIDVGAWLAQIGGDCNGTD